MALVLGACCQKHGSHAGCLADAVSGDGARHELHGVVDCEAGGDRSARRVDVDVDVLVLVHLGQEQHLGNDRVRNHIVDRGPDEDDPVFKKARVDVVSPLTPSGLLDNEWNELVCLLVQWFLFV